MVKKVQRFSDVPRVDASPAINHAASSVTNSGRESGGRELSTSERIIAAATALFAKKGFAGTSTKEICEAAAVNIAAVHYHFGTKEQLLRHILESYGGARLKALQRTLEPPKNAGELSFRLRMFLAEALEPFLLQPDLCRLVQTEMELLHARSEDAFRKTFLPVFETLVDFLSQAKRQKLIAKDIDPRLAGRMLYSLICQGTRCDDVNQRLHGVSLRDSAYRAKWLDQVLSVFLNGVSGVANEDIRK
jgi:AcrR family transcriptional regulator